MKDMKTLDENRGTCRSVCAGGLAAAGRRRPRAEATETVTAAATEVVPVMDKGDVAWMMISTVLVLFMILPGVALFYGGLVRTKNMLSVLMQCTVITALVMVIWVFWGYSMAFGGGTGAYWGGLGKAFLAGVTPDSMAATFTAGRGHSGIRLHRLPDDLRRDHSGADHRRLCRTREVLRGDAVHRAVGDGRLLSRSHTWSGISDGLDLWLGRARLCRWHSGAHQCRYRGTGRLH